jgi:hypothetical protein
MAIPRGHHQKEAGPPSSGNALNLVRYLPPLETISSSLPILWESIAYSTFVQLPGTMTLMIPCAILWESIACSTVVPLPATMALSIPCGRN